MQWAVILAVLVQSVLGGNRCEREPDGLKIPGDNGFRISIMGEPEKFVPGSVYTVSLLGNQDYTAQFSRFMLVVEPMDPRLDASPQKVGSFQLFGDDLTAFNERCVNTVMEASDHPKTEVQVMWTAPPAGSGCVVFRAMVMESSEVWYMDDGALSREICEDQQNDEAEVLEECCACDEAKYQMVFEGIWSNVTHPRDFPFSLWLTHFSDVIGASHENNFKFWGEGEIASEGLRQVAEWGAVRSMENELRDQSQHIRTIIKAAGLWYPRVNENTTATFRVDRKHHLVSVVSMLGPSPDWILGLSGYELCLRNCSWAESRIVDLYPYDAGTDSGITYMSPNSPSNPQEKITRITTSYPADPRSPFYDPSGPEMKPLARVYLTRERLFEKSCDDNSALTEDTEISENTEETDRPECAVSEWSEWSICSVTCGKGIRMRQRSYLNQMKAEMMGCDRQLVSKEMCVADLPTCGGEDESVCAVTSWGPWSSCSVTCGEGVKMRTRRYLEKMGRKKCRLNLVEKEQCSGETAICEEEDIEEVNPMCAVTEWSDWSPCSATCGKGVRMRTRLYLVSLEQQAKCNLEMVEKDFCMESDCVMDMAEAKETCMQEKEVGPCRGYFARFYFDAQKGMCSQFVYGGCRGNRNNFETHEQCNTACEIVRDLLLVQNNTIADSSQSEEGEEESSDAGPVIDCMVTPWGPWSACSATCGKGRSEKIRMIKVQPQNGGRPCPKKLFRKKKCRSPPCDA